jgi:hypothetical protein
LKDKEFFKDWCIVCSNPFDPKTRSTLPEYEGTCVKCRKVLMEEAPGVPLYGTSWGGSIEDMIEELEHRIPGLFSGDECPIDFANGNGCSCTYETGCQALKIGKTIKKLPKST